MPPLLVLVVAVLATTYAGPIVRFATAPAVAIAFWRLTLVLPVTGALAGWEWSTEHRAVPSGAPGRTAAPRSVLPLMTLSGVLLALHFWSWIASLRFTTVASSVVLVSLKPVFAWGVDAMLLREMRVGDCGGRDRSVFGAKAAGPMLVGHTGMNYALRHFRATTVNVAALGEPVGASVIAWLLPSIREVPPLTALVGGLLVLVGITLSLGAGSREQGAV